MDLPLWLLLVALLAVVAGFTIFLWLGHEAERRDRAYMEWQDRRERERMIKAIDEENQRRRKKKVDKLKG